MGEVSRSAAIETAEPAAEYSVCNRVLLRRN